MGRRKGSSNNNKKSSNSSTTENSSPPNHLQVTADEDVEEISNLDNSTCDPADDVIGSDKTSADYYFDSYSHFGMYAYDFSSFFISINLPFFFLIWGFSCVFGKWGCGIFGWFA